MNDLEEQIRDMYRRREGDAPSLDSLDAQRVTARTRRRQILNGIGAVGVAAAIAVLFAGVAEIRTAGPFPADQPTPSVTPPPSPFTEGFDSPLNGLSIGYPSGWHTRAATEPWAHDKLAFGAHDVDVIFDPTFREDLYLALVSEPLGGKSGPEWADAASWLESVGICDGSGYGGGGGSTWAGAAYAWFENCGEPDGAVGHVVLLASAARGYIIYLHVADDRLHKSTYDEDWFRAALETLDLRPEDALDRLNPSASA